MEQVVLNTVIDFLTSKNINFDGPSLVVASFSFIVAVLSIVVSIVGYKFSKRMFYIQSKRLAYEGAEVHVKRISDIIFTAKVTRPRKDTWWKDKSDEEVEKYINNFNQRNGRVFTELNVSCSAFTLTRSLAHESYADANVGLKYCEFMKPYYKTLKHISESTRQYRDAVLLYELWDLKHDMRFVSQELNEVQKENASTNREILSIYWGLFRILLKKIYAVKILKDADARKDLKDVIATANRLQKVRDAFVQQTKQYRKNQKRFQKNERRLRKKMKHMRPLGL